MICKEIRPALRNHPRLVLHILPASRHQKEGGEAGGCDNPPRHPVLEHRSARNNEAIVLIPDP
jgi:hypothetical protein